MEEGPGALYDDLWGSYAQDRGIIGTLIDRSTIPTSAAVLEI